MKRRIRKWPVFLWIVTLVVTPCIFVEAQEEVPVSAPSAILIEASTGQVIYEKNPDEIRSPASVTKIMTLLLTFEALADGRTALDDYVTVSEHAASMGGSQVFLECGEVQTLETMIKCIAVSSANDASVAVAEFLAGSEEAFVMKMNEKAKSLGMKNTSFEDCCGLTDSDGHYTTARDISLMSAELVGKYPEIYDYTRIWMENILHKTARGSSEFTLSSTNKLLKQYQWTTGLKTGFTSKAKYCISATATQGDMDLIAVIMGAESSKQRNQDAQMLFQYGFQTCRIFEDENSDPLPPVLVKHGVENQAQLRYEEKFRYLSAGGSENAELEKKLELPEVAQAPIRLSDPAGYARYYLNGKEIGSVKILYAQNIDAADFGDCMKKVFHFLLL